MARNLRTSPQKTCRNILPSRSARFSEALASASGSQYLRVNRLMTALNPEGSVHGIRTVLRLLCCCAVLTCTWRETQASLILTSGLGTTHAGNLVINGSFEIGAPPDGLGNAYYWANPAAAPYVVPPGWTSTGPHSTALWGNDGPSPYRLRLSDVLPDGRAALDFHTSTGATVSQPPTFHPNGSVTFPATPIFTTPAGSPVTLRQTVHTELTPAPSYNLSFWVSGEENSTVQGNTGVGIIGLIVTNVLPPSPAPGSAAGQVQWLAVPNGLSYGLSHLYEYTFTPVNPLQPVNIEFISWGGMNLSAYGMSPFGTQPILDDVIVNAVPEPTSFGLLGLGSMLMLRRRPFGCFPEP
ncbi:MAG TPA: PEP-CTERM sorting domain-containing protein [Phycisphaerae bacterium]|nr:PEP-CTERM sorting domain-containing protein [Phycisphaerae bacterium]